MDIFSKRATDWMLMHSYCEEVDAKRPTEASRIFAELVARYGQRGATRMIEEYTYLRNLRRY